MASEAFILSGIRTPMGALGGALAEVPAPELGAIAIRQAVQLAGVQPGAIDEVIMGNVISAGLGQNPARQAAIRAGLPVAVGATTINKVCGSGLKAVMLATQAIRLGEAQIVVAGGMESMSRAPYLLLKARQGYRMGNGELFDAMILDGLLDAYGAQHMGVYGDRCAERCSFSREELDNFAVRSYTRACKAAAAGIFKDEIVPVPVMIKKQTMLVSEDEGPARFDEAKLRTLRPVFGERGTVTAANASSISDGGAALVLGSPHACEKHRLHPIARVVGMATFSREPEWFSLAPIGALRKLLEQLHWTVPSTDLFEINEAFAAVTLAAERELGIPAEKVNIYGGAVALGHPIGCSGARILVTLLNGLRHSGGKRGVACLCIGGGEAVAVAVEMIAAV